MMNKQHDDYEVVPYPKVRRVLGAMYPSIQRRPLIHGLLEVDVTRARAFLREHKAKTGEALSFTAFIITCLAQAVDENKALHAYRKGKKHLVLFDEVDVATFIEREVAGHSQPISSLIRAANKKTFREIHQEIRGAQVGASRSPPGQLQSHALGGGPADGGLQRLLGDLLARARPLSTGAKAPLRHGGHHSRGHVRERRRLGNPRGRTYPHDYAGRHCGETGCGGRAHRHPGISQPDAQHKSCYR